MPPGVTDKDGSGSGSPAGREQIIQQHNPFICAYTIDMHLHFSFAVLERVLGDLRLIGKLATFANRNETDAKFIRNGLTEKKPTRINPDNFVDCQVATPLQEEINRRTEQRRIIQHGRDILKHDPFLWKIGHIAHSCMELLDDRRGHWRER